ncbi:hypothetical protein H0H92_009204 [Tricholoma furcatifolium]|nr:hypothetical protein H0H92_009204 [Tricholoma furcatifolium]
MSTAQNNNKKSKTAQFLPKLRSLFKSQSPSPVNEGSLSQRAESKATASSAVSLQATLTVDKNASADVNRLNVAERLNSSVPGSIGAAAIPASVASLKEEGGLGSGEPKISSPIRTHYFMPFIAVVAHAFETQLPGSGDIAFSGRCAQATPRLRTFILVKDQGTVLLLNKIEPLTSGTPAKLPIAVINTIIGLGMAVAENQDELRTLMTRTASRLDTVQRGLVDNNSTDSNDIIRNFSRNLIAKLMELEEMSKTAMWKKILESEKDKGKITDIFKDIDEETKNFQIRLALRIDHNTQSLRESLNALRLDTWPHSERAIYDNNLEDVPTLARLISKQSKDILAHWSSRIRKIYYCL